MRRFPPRHVPVAVERAVLARDGRRCRKCGRDDEHMPIHFDHIWPWAKGGPSTVDNIQILCASCNLSKSARVPDSASGPTEPGTPKLRGSRPTGHREPRRARRGGDARVVDSLAGHE